ncbi:hypothetical protein ACIHEJ_18140 [Streptomyces sp. NPDC052301]|uniref:hypothetical protein n=1 Tax=Streptomyces sp. NPDC052301 TaxID=3365687 RepID=UPI0037CDB2E0
MAYVTSRKNAHGEITNHQVKWGLGGSRSAPQQTVRLDGDEAGAEAAEIFCQAVNDNGRQWPPGWVKGDGCIDPAAGMEQSYIFSNCPRECIKNKTGVEERYRQDCYRELETYLQPRSATATSGLPSTSPRRPWRPGRTRWPRRTSGGARSAS